MRLSSLFPISALTIGLASTMSGAAVQVDQAGYLPAMAKIAFVNQAADSFQLVDTSEGRVVLRGTCTELTTADAATGKAVYAADFSSWQTAGRYLVRVPGNGDSFPFIIGDSVYTPVFAKSLKGFFFQRCGSLLLPSAAGLYTHVACHTSDAYFHSATGETGSRPATGGWHDAGDYGKYVVNAGITVETLLMAYEYFPDRFQSDQIGIPESGNSLPDLLDEVLYELLWLKKMQAGSGGVYCKLTREQFAPFIMPNKDTEKRYLYIITTAATADFSAMMARASRTYRTYNPIFADSCLQMAEKAWTYLTAHPSIEPAGGFHNPTGTATGEYGDGDDTDERMLAAAELFEATGQETYHNYFLQNYAKSALFSSAMAWPQMKPLALITYLYSRQSSAQATAQTRIQAALLAYAEKMVTQWSQSGYRVLLKPGEYVWGSNADALNKAILLIFAYDKTAERRFLQIALDQLHYVLGTNAHNMTFVTGVGSASPRNIHHRPSASDGIAAPVPGLLSGGANQYLNDAVLAGRFNSSTPPALCYVDQLDSYASNEICLNWNAPLVFVAGYFAAGHASAVSNPRTGSLPQGLHLRPNYPNPFHASTTVFFELEKAGEVRLKIFNILGQMVDERPLGLLADGEQKFVWHYPASAEQRMGAGVYLVRLEAADQVATRKILYIP